MDDVFAHFDNAAQAPWESDAPKALPVRAPFADAPSAVAFMLAGNATVTLRSTSTGARYTYRVRAAQDGAVSFVALLGGQDNESDYRYLGYIRHGVSGAMYFHGGRKAKVGFDAPSAKAFAWSYGRLAKGEMPQGLEVWHEGCCGRCGRKLTVPESIASGFGPECSRRLGAD